MSDERMEDGNMGEDARFSYEGGAWADTGPTEFQSEMLKTLAEARSQSGNVHNLMMALALAQGQIGEIARDRTVTVRPRSGGTPYHFKYATLSNIIKGIKKALSDNFIAYTQVLTWSHEHQLYYLTTSLHHGNQFISSVAPLIISSSGGNQEFGSALTYMKRYALAALVGVAAEEDDDGNIADGNEIKASQDVYGWTKTSEKAPAPVMPDVIQGLDGPNAGTTAETIPFSSAKIDVPIMEDGSGTDWVGWGKMIVAEAKRAPDVEGLDALQKANSTPLKNMELSAPRMFANLSLALLKTRKALEKPL